MKKACKNTHVLQVHGGHAVYRQYLSVADVTEALTGLKLAAVADAEDRNTPWQTRLLPAANTAKAGYVNKISDCETVKFVVLR